MQEIPIQKIENIKIGNEDDAVKGTGCTVVICEKGAPTGVDVRGGGPASRETELLNPVASAQAVHAVLLSGGSAFGLDAAGGVMRFLKEKEIGFDTGVIKVPLVCQSCIFDLVVGQKDAWPDQQMAYKACENAWKGEPLINGNAGAGMGATVGKYHGPQTMMKSGLGSYALQTGELKVGAVVSVNALGDIFDDKDGRRLAGMLTADQSAFDDTETAMYQDIAVKENLFTGNTTIGVIVTNAVFTKSEMKKIASMAQNGFARTINPVHTMADGDSIYAMSTGMVQADINVVGTLAAQVMAEAIKRAVTSAKPAYGLKAYSSFLK